MRMVRRGAGLLFLRMLAFACALTLSASAFAETSAGEGETVRVVLLKVSDGGTERLAEAIDDIDGVEVRDQSWLVGELRERGIATKNVMKRPRDLRWVMDGAEIDYILYLDVRDEDAYDGHVVGSSGEIVRSFVVDRDGRPLSSRDVKLVVDELAEELGRPAEPKKKVVLEAVPEEGEEPVVEVFDDEDEDDEDEADESADEKEDEPEVEGDPWLWARPSFQLLKRDLIATGAGAVLTYESAFYPGFGFNVEAYPTVLFAPSYADLGLYLDYVMGFDSVSVPTSDDGPRRELSVTHVELEGGPIYRIEGAAREPRMWLRATVRHSSFSLDPNTSLPSLGTTSLVAAARMLYPLSARRWALRTDLELIPAGVQADGAELFGDSSYIYGFGAGLGVVYAPWESLGLELAYRLRMQRVSFEGQGELDFADSDIVELVQGLSLGVVFRL